MGRAAMCARGWSVGRERAIATLETGRARADRVRAGASGGSRREREATDVQVARSSRSIVHEGGSQNQVALSVSVSEQKCSRTGSNRTSGWAEGT